METNEIMTNENTMETTEELAKKCSGNGLNIAAGIGVAILVGGLAYKYVVRPAVAKIKSKKEEDNNEDNVVDVDFVNDEEPEEDEDE